MKKVLIIFTYIACVVSAFAQDIPPSTEQQLENLTDVDQAETEDDSFLQLLEQYRRNPLNINNAEMNDLRELRMLTDLQISSLLSYRRLFGNIISLYELQAVPTWDIITIRKLLPYITLASPLSIKDDFANRFGQGTNNLLFRVSQVLEKSKGFKNNTGGSHYLGSPQRVFLRYRYSFKNLLQYGIVGDKDAGEQFFRGSQKSGFDFYSFHLFARNMGRIKALAIGDFTVNLGQGLIQWQSLAFKKSVDVMAVKRQSAVLKPYNSAGEYNFKRGVGTTVSFGKVEATLFSSYRKLSANFAIDTAYGTDYFTSFQTSGYHRTGSENADRNELNQFSFGGNLRYSGNRFQVGINAVHFIFSAPLQKTDDPYNRFALNGDNWSNASIDYSYTYRNLHFFGETAVDKNSNLATVNGLLVSVDSRVDFSLVHRSLAAGYQAIDGNAFTESTYPSNERGMYAGITVRPTAAWRLDAFADLYHFPWLKYLVDAPAYGKDFLAQLTYTPNRQVEIYTRLRNETKQANFPENATPVNYLVSVPKKNWRTQITYKFNPASTIRSRVEVVWLNHEDGPVETGFLTYFDYLYKPLMKRYSAVVRIQYFETGGYDSRIYAYENDVLYSYSIPGFFDKGYRYYVTFNYDLTKSLSCWLRIAQTVYRDKGSIGSGLDEISGNKKTEIKCQVRLLF